MESIQIERLYTVKRKAVGLSGRLGDYSIIIDFKNKDQVKENIYIYGNGLCIMQMCASHGRISLPIHNIGVVFEVKTVRRNMPLEVSLYVDVDIA